MAESVLLSVHVTASVELSRPNAKVEQLHSFELPVEVPEEVAGRAVGTFAWDAKEALENYVAERVVVRADERSITVEDQDGTALCKFVLEADETLINDPAPENSPFFAAAGSEVVSLQISGVDEA